MGKWLTPLRVEVVGDRSYLLIEPLRYEDDNGEIHEAPTGQATDFGSTWGTPLVSMRLDGRAQKACSLHDHHYRTGKITRKRSDELLREGALAEGEPEDIADEFYNGVRVFGKSSYKGPVEWND